MPLIQNSVVNNGGVPGALAGTLANRPAVAADGQIYIANDPGNFAIYQYMANVPGWISLTGGGGGSQDLQSVCGIGHVTNTDIEVDVAVGESKFIGIFGGLPIPDARGIIIFSDDANDSGILRIFHKDGSAADIIFEGGGALTANLRPSVVTENIAYLSDLIDKNQNTFIPTFSTLVNLSSVTTIAAFFSRLGNTVTVSLWLTATAVAAGLCTFLIDLPVATLGGDVVGQLVGEGAANSFIPGTVITGSATTAKCKYTELAALGIRNLSVTFSYFVT